MYKQRQCHFQVSFVLRKKVSKVKKRNRFSEDSMKIMAIFLISRQKGVSYDVYARGRPQFSFEEDPWAL